MASIEVGRVCVKTAGREAGEIEPTADSIDVSGDAESIKAALADL